MLCSSIHIKAVFEQVYLSSSSIASYCLNEENITKTHDSATCWWRQSIETYYTRLETLVKTYFPLLLNTIIITALKKNTQIDTNNNHEQYT